MSIKVNDFRWEKGKNDLEYIALLEKNRDVMLNNFRKCSKVAREQYNKGRKDVIAEANLAHNIECGDCVRQITAADETRIRAEEREKHFKAIMEFINTPNRGECDYFIVDQIEDYIMARMREGEQNAKDNT